MISIVIAVAAIAADVGPRPSDTRFYELASAKVSSFLADPEAARFKWDMAVSAQSEKALAGPRPRGWWTCGLVNAKNRYGAYVGYRRFIAIVRDDRVTYTSTSDGYDSFADRVCDIGLKAGMLEALPEPVVPGGGN